MPTDNKDNYCSVCGQNHESTHLNECDRLVFTIAKDAIHRLEVENANIRAALESSEKIRHSEKAILIQEIEENARLRAALKPIHEVWEVWEGWDDPSVSDLYDAINKCMEILKGKESIS